MIDESTSQPTSEPANEHDVKIGRIVALAIVSVIFIIVSGMSSCQITKEIYRSDVIDAETALVNAQSEFELKQSDAIRDLIDGSVNPIAARCAVVGWKGPEETTICALFIRDVNILRD